MDFFTACHSFGVLERRNRAYITAACDRWHLNYLEFVLLRLLHVRDGQYQDEVAADLMADKAIVARTVKSLEAKHFIYRKKDKNDGRYKHIYLTDAGKALQEPIERIIEHWLTILTQGMSEEMIQQVTAGIKLASENAMKTRIPLKGDVADVEP